MAGEHADAIGREAHQMREIVAQALHALTFASEGEAAGFLVERGERRARLHRRDDDAGDVELQLRDMRSRSKSLRHLVGVAIGVVEHAIAGDAVVDRRGAGGFRRLHRGERRQRLDIEDHRLRRVARFAFAGGDDQSDGIADIAHAVRGKGPARRRGHFRAVAIGEADDGAEVAVALAFEIGGGEDARDARHGARGGGVDAEKPAMRLRAAHEDAVELAFDGEIVGVRAAAAHQRRVFHAADGLADAEFEFRRVGDVDVHAGLTRFRRLSHQPTSG